MRRGPSHGTFLSDASWGPVWATLVERPGRSHGVRFGHSLVRSAYFSSHGHRTTGPISDPHDPVVLCVERYRNTMPDRVGQSELPDAGTHSPDNPSIAVSHVVREDAGQPQD